jgi:hypothetical protein
LIARGRTPLNQNNWANPQPYGGHGKAGAPKAPAKGGHGIKIGTINKDDLDDGKIASVEATKLAWL